MLSFHRMTHLVAQDGVVIDMDNDIAELVVTVL